MANPSPTNSDQPVLKVKGLKTYFYTEDGVVQAINGVDFAIKPGQVMGLVGESGSGKSVTSLSIMRLLPASGKIVEGEIWFDQQNLANAPESLLLDLRGNELSMIFQQPTSCLNPVFRIGDQIAEALVTHQSLSKETANQQAIELLRTVGIADPQRRAAAYPHEISGGMAQRVMIAMALACRPKLLIADEPTTALDVTIQAQILDLMRNLRSETNTAILLITHDMGVIAEMCDMVAVMYAGQIVEHTDVYSIFEEQLHPYAEGLLAAIPVLGVVQHTLAVIPGSVPNLINLPPGCKFHPRCPYAKELCAERMPELALLYAPAGHRPFMGRCAQGVVEFSGYGSGCARKRSELIMAVSVPVSKRDMLVVQNLKTYFPVRAGLFQKVVAHVKAVDDVSFTVREGETFGLVGESGCGKTTVSRTILRLIPATAGSVFFDGQDVFNMRSGELKALRRQMQVVFQDPYSSLDPRMPVGDIIAEGLLIHGMKNSSERNAVVQEMLDKVGLNPYHAHRYPHEFSGGQRQRIGIARALSLRPRFIVCDEPVSALDVSIQSQILNLLKELQREFGFSYLFVAHDLSVVEHISDRVGVMYLGKMVEVASREDLYRDPLHPYTRALLSAIPVPDPRRKRERVVLKGEVPSPLNPPSGCRFHPRCPLAQDICKQVEPPFEEKRAEHWVACHMVDAVGKSTPLA
jgi:peptide/nickel transport system ATP-binding protein